MKQSTLIYTLILVAITSYLLTTFSLPVSALFLSFSMLALVVAVGLLVSVNSFFLKFLAVVIMSLVALNSVDFDLYPSLLLSSLFIYSACLWTELEKFSRGERWEAHYRISHKMRHNWLSGLSFFAGLMTAYVILSVYDLYSPLYSLLILALFGIVNFAYIEANRLHNIHTFWVDVSQRISVSGHYWRMLVSITSILIVLGINFNEKTSEGLLTVRTFFEKDEEQGPSNNDQDFKTHRTTSGFSPGEVSLSKKVDITLVDQDEFYVRIDAPQQNSQLQNEIFYMSAQELVYFNGKSWLPKTTEVEWFMDRDDGKEDGFITVNQPRKGSIKQTIFLIKPETTAIFSLPGLHTIQLPEVYLSSLGVYGIRPSVENTRRRYSVYSNFFSYNRLLKDRNLLLDYPGDEYLDLPDDPIIDKIKQLNSTIVRSGMTQLQRLSAIRNYLKFNCQYSLRVENKEDRAPLDNFLFHERKGHCLLYASAFTLMLRQAGIPSRLVNGFAGGSYDSKNKIFVMKASNAHAWTEVYFARYGWVVVDPTPEAENIQPTTAKLNDFAEADFESLSKKASQIVKNESKSFFGGDTNSLILTICFSMVILSYFWQFLKKIPALKFLAQKQNTTQKFRPKPEFIIAFEDFCKNHGVILTKAKTPKEMLQELSPDFYCQEFDELVNYYYSVRFASAERLASKEANWLQLIRSKS